MSAPFDIIKTANIDWGSGLPYSLDFADFYFASELELTKCSQTFIDGSHLIARWQALPCNTPSQFVIAETAFGSALTFLLTWSLWKKHAPKLARLHFITCEQHPWSITDLSHSRSLFPALHDEYCALLANYPTVLTPGFHFLPFEDHDISLTLMLGDVPNCYRQLMHCGDAVLENRLRDTHVDAWFLNGSSSARQFLIGDEKFLSNCGLLSKSVTTLTALSTEALDTSALQQAGFRVNAITNIGKCSLITADFVKFPSPRIGRVTPWHCSEPRAVKNKQALILGAGLAGCYTARALARRGWEVVLIDKASEVGCGASGNRQAILYPKLSSYRSPLTEFLLSAYLFAVGIYKKILHGKEIGKLNGMLQFSDTNEEDLHTWLLNYPTLGRWVKAEEATTLAGVTLKEGGFFVPDSGWLDCKALCQHLINHPKIKWRPNTTIEELYYQDGIWHLSDQTAETVILANGDSLGQFQQTRYLPLKAIHGQMTSIAPTEESRALQRALCGSAHVLPVRDGVHQIGATYNLHSRDAVCYSEDDNLNLFKLRELATDAIWSSQIEGNWAGIRVATPDYLPLVGPVADAQNFREQFAGFATNSKRWIPAPGSYYPGLYVCAAFGSRGLTSIPLSAEWLAATINQEPSCLPRNLIQAISSARFLCREIVRKSNSHMDK